MLDSFLTFSNFFTALRSVPAWQVILELLIIGAVVYWVIRFLQGTRGARLLKGIVFVLITLYLSVRLLGAVLDLGRLEILFDSFLFYASFAIIIVFQPELRRALMRLGETRLFRSIGQTDTADEIAEIVDACTTLSRRRIGALIALERDVGLGGFTEEATRVNGDVTSALIQTIFYPNTALHDLGMIISGGKIAWAGVQFPLAETGELPKELGSRHRAAVGLSSESDAVIVIVSEETGDISIAERGHLLRKRSGEQLRADLLERMGQSVSIPLDDERPSASSTTRDRPAAPAGPKVDREAAEARPAASTASKTSAADSGPADRPTDASVTEPSEPAPIREVKPVGGKNVPAKPAPQKQSA